MGVAPRRYLPGRNAMLANEAYVRLENIVFPFHCKQVPESNFFEKTDFIRFANNNRIIVFMFQTYDNSISGLTVCGGYTCIPNDATCFDFSFGSQLLVDLN